MFGSITTSKTCFAAAVGVSTLLAVGCTGGPSDTADAPGMGDKDVSTRDTGDSTDPELTGGEAIFYEPVEDGNTFACAICHAVEAPARDGYRKPGHPLFDATKRPSYKNGKVDEMRVAVNSCLQEWMNAEPWSADDPRWKSLYGWLDEQAPDGEVDALSYEQVEPPDDLTGGDPDEGRSIFNDSCAGCHAQDGTGTNKAPPLAGKSYDPDLTAKRVRTSGRESSEIYDGLTGGIMPFWAKDRLSDDELRDIVAYLAEDDSPTDDTGMNGGMDAGMDRDSGSGTDTSRNCKADDEMVGATADLNDPQNPHAVGGTAEIVDNCTVEIRNFTYDGRGIVVEIYGTSQVIKGPDGNVQGPDFDAGYSMSENLVKSDPNPNDDMYPYDGATLRFQLPSDKTLDDLEYISVWCVEAGISFGDGEFTR